jgi:hypothetical protein
MRGGVMVMHPVSRLRGVLLVSLLAGGSALGAAAQDWTGPAGVGVEVRDEGGQPIPGAAVVLVPGGTAGAEAPPFVFTDASGRVEVRNLAEGEWQVEVRAAGYMIFNGYLKLAGAAAPEVGFSSRQRTGTFWQPLQVRFFVPGSPGDAMMVASTKEERKDEKKRVEERQELEKQEKKAQERAEARDRRRTRPTGGAEVARLREPTPTAPPPQPAAEAEPPTQVAEARPPGDARETGGAPAPQPEAAERAEEAAAPPPPPEPPAAPPRDQPRAPAADPAPPPPAPTTQRPQPPAPVPPPPAEAQPEPRVADVGRPASDAPRPDAPARPAAPARDTAPPAAAPSPDTAPRSPAPVPAPPAAPPSTAPSPPRSVPSIQARPVLFTGGACPECKPGEWALIVERRAAPSTGAGDEAAACGSARDAVARRLAAEVLAPAGAAVAAFAGPVADAWGNGLPPAVRAALPADLGEALGARDGSCQDAIGVLPQGARFIGFRFEAEDAGGKGDCFGEDLCAIGQARWTSNPRIERTATVTVIHSSFRNESTSTERRGRMTLYFQPPRGWQPPG